MKRKDYIILKKIADYCEQTKEACRMFENSFATFQENSVFRNACNMCILQIGELCKVLSEEVKEREPEVSWKGWCGIRDVFAHQYSNLDYQAAWDTIENDMPVLEKCVKHLLESE